MYHTHPTRKRSTRAAVSPVQPPAQSSGPAFPREVYAAFQRAPATPSWRIPVPSSTPQSPSGRHPSPSGTAPQFLRITEKQINQRSTKEAMADKIRQHKGNFTSSFDSLLFEAVPILLQRKVGAHQLRHAAHERLHASQNYNKKVSEAKPKCKHFDSPSGATGGRSTQGNLRDWHNLKLDHPTKSLG